MEALLSFFQTFIGLGAAVLLPVVICILGLFFRMKIGPAVKAGLSVGIGFSGLVLVVNLLITTIKPVMAYYEAMGSGYNVLEIGFAALGGAAWTVPFAVFAIPAIVIINLILVFIFSFFITIILIFIVCIVIILIFITFVVVVHIFSCVIVGIRYVCSCIAVALFTSILVFDHSCRV